MKKTFLVFEYLFLFAILPVLISLPVSAEVLMENVEYGGWPNCVRLSDGTLELVVTTDVGPRIIRCGFVGGENLFYEATDDLGKTGGETWRIYGGHRLWHAPEQVPRTYVPDNEAVKLVWDGDRLVLTSPREPWTAVQKEMEIELFPNRNRIRVIHRIANHNLWEIELAAWAITALREGGYAILPRTPIREQKKDLLPVQTLSLWSYTDLADPRLVWGKEFIRVRADASRPEALKIGILNTEGWAAYVLDNEIFLKQFEFKPGKTYPDFNSNTEVYTRGDMLELETLGPLTKLKRGTAVEWTEWWTLARAELPTDDRTLREFFASLIEPTATEPKESKR